MHATVFGTKRPPVQVRLVPAAQCETHSAFTSLLSNDRIVVLQALAQQFLVLAVVW